ncbi:BTAD domain-containing putative transcriptional regulator [Massilia pseudoviolaceinigra]|uniref:BTAD domain-containing putative transcriptional regulator n=1 Tax=Massilia pseudoviolaceinigra TaxID=3057165 RepID=UPI0027969B84|nr:BTAD domain-containing putative transcriptional regulator [Massilia sp. CCM 9206]MDQ1924291.1 BTAD domain-containing putative transcriptional regulator [Massilia sp. CCM 9206]
MATRAIGTRTHPRPHAVPAYAKLTLPRLFEPLQRTRLFSLIDRLRGRHAVLWISSPPGAGKTTLAASYALQCEAPVLWCQLDQGDADPATLLFFLADALRTLDGDSPWHVPQVAGDAAQHARLFFRQFYAHLPQGALVVLDNVHDVDWNNAGYLLEAACAEVPAGVTLLAVSREAPPTCLARMELDGRLGMIGWDALRLDAAETRALAQADDLADQEVAQWLDLVDGWAAGVALLRSVPGQPRAGLAEGREALFRYFAGEIVGRLPAQSQHLLLMLACLPAMSGADAHTLTGDPGAPLLLERLYRRRLFVERRGDSYAFHGLFGAFLRRQARELLDPAQRLALTAQAAAIADAHGRIDEAASLYIEAQAHQALAAFLLRRAAGMVASGRGQSLRLWMSCLPADMADTRPWLAYWHGVSLADVQPLHARRILIRAERAFEQAGDLPARLQAVSAIIDTYDAEWADFSALPRWLAVLTEGVQALDPVVLDPALDLRLHSRMACALLYVAPQSPLLAACVQRARLALDQVDDPLARLEAGACLLRYFDSMDNAGRANALVAQLGACADDAAVGASHRVRWYGRVARWYNKEGDLGQAQRITGEARRIVIDAGLDPVLFQSLEVHHLLGTGAVDAARSLLDQMRATLPASSPLQLVELNALDAQCLALAGDLAGALNAARETLRLAVDAGVPARERARFDAFLGACHAWAGAYAPALECYGQAVAAAFGVQALLLGEERDFIDACASAASGEGARAAALMDAAMASHRRRQTNALFATVPALAARVAALALENGIDAAHVGAIVMRQRLAAPTRCVQGWPWPVAVRTLGKFELTLHGAPVVATGKAQQRPLALLRNLVAAGEGGKAQAALVAQLWGSTDVAKSALNVTVHRLRKLLLSDEAVVVSGGRTRLAEQRVWTDVSALADLCASIASLPAHAEVAEVGRCSAALLDLYRGPFCDGADDTWILPVRERARNLFLAAVGQLGRLLEAMQEWGCALSLYQRALAAEPLSEANYRGWMRCAHAQDGAAAAFGAYRRCRDTLSIVLGVSPSYDTEKLAVALGLR